MNILRSSSFFRSRYPLAVVAGLLLASSFPGVGVAGLAWIAPGLMIASAMGKRGAERFRIGYVAGLTHYLAMLHWLLFIPYRWHGIPFGPAAGWLALSGFLALFPGFWVWLMSPAEGSFNPPTPAPGHGSDARNPLTKSWAQRSLWALAGAAVWVALEMILARIFGGFPWDLLGVSQYQLVPLIQIASVTGVYGVSFLVVWMSLSMLLAGFSVIQRPNARSAWLSELFVPMLAVALCFNLGFREARREPPSDRTLRLTLIQPSIPQTVIWDPNSGAARFRDLIRLSEQVLTNQTDLLIWPEAAIPQLLRWDKDTSDAISGLASRHRVWMIVGSDDAEPRHNPRNPNDADYFNSCFLIGPDGKLVERYVKRNLVIFGEYVPLARWLPFLEWVTPVQGGFTPGTNSVPFRLGNLEVETRVLICYEDVFPQLARNDASDRTDFLVNLTNDGWFGEGAAQWQHAVTAVFRSVETHLPLVRCSNNGLTC